MSKANQLYTRQLAGQAADGRKSAAGGATKNSMYEFDYRSQQQAVEDLRGPPNLRGQNSNTGRANTALGGGYETTTAATLSSQRQILRTQAAWMQLDRDEFQQQQLLQAPAAGTAKGS